MIKFNINNFQNLCNISITRNLWCIADIVTRQGIKIISLTPDKNVWIRQFFFFLNFPRPINLLQTNITPQKIISLKNFSKLEIHIPDDDITTSKEKGGKNRW